MDNYISLRISVNNTIHSWFLNVNYLKKNDMEKKKIINWLDLEYIKYFRQKKYNTICMQISIDNTNYNFPIVINENNENNKNLSNETNSENNIKYRTNAVITLEAENSNDLKNIITEIFHKF